MSIASLLYGILHSIHNILWFGLPSACLPVSIFKGRGIGQNLPSPKAGIETPLFKVMTGTLGALIVELFREGGRMAEISYPKIPGDLYESDGPCSRHSQSLILISHGAMGSVKQDRLSIHLSWDRRLCTKHMTRVTPGYEGRRRGLTFVRINWVRHPNVPKTRL